MGAFSLLYKIRIKRTHDDTCMSFLASAIGGA
jgi:hypothetical protein